MREPTLVDATNHFTIISGSFTCTTITSHFYPPFLLIWYQLFFRTSHFIGGVYRSYYIYHIQFSLLIFSHCIVYSNFNAISSLCDFSSVILNCVFFLPIGCWHVLLPTYCSYFRSESYCLYSYWIIINFCHWRSCWFVFDHLWWLWYLIR